MQTGLLVGFEALARCDRKGNEPILPAMFALAFDDRNLAVAISRQMIDQALDDIHGWVESGLTFGHVAINTSAADFSGDDFAEMLLDSI